MDRTRVVWKIWYVRETGSCYRILPLYGDCDLYVGAVRLAVSDALTPSFVDVRRDLQTRARLP